jgi:putative addiction module CopG family antidote
VNLSPELQAFVEEAVRSGRFADEKDVICEALETLRTHEEFREFQLGKLKEKLQAGLEDIEAGHVAEWDGEEIKRRGRAILARRLAGS